jgi:hypothetical protein
LISPLAAPACLAHGHERADVAGRDVREAPASEDLLTIQVLGGREMLVDPPLRMIVRLLAVGPVIVEEIDVSRTRFSKSSAGASTAARVLYLHQSAQGSLIQH